MAASLRQMSLLALRKGEKSMLDVMKTKTTMTAQTARTVVTTETGAFLPKPEVQRLGIVKVFACAIPGIYIGATVAREGAAFLEENDIFVPDDDDD